MRHIEWLLTTHNCVVIPRVGAVLAHYKSAEISDDGCCFMPPCRVYTFNADLKVTDGLVESSIARSLGVSHERASAIVAADVDTMIHQLHNDSHLSLGRIGTLWFDRDSETIEFRPFRRDGISHLASWLPDTSLAYFDSDRQEESAVSAAGTMAAKTASPLRRFLKATAAAAVFAAIAFVASTPITVRNANYASTSLPAVTAPRTAYVPSMTTPMITMPRMADQPVVDTAARSKYQHDLRAAADEKAAPAAMTEKKAEKPADNTSKPPQNTQVRFNEADPYCVIVGSLNSEEEAREHMARLSRNYPHPLGVLIKDGRYRVYAATGATKAQANAAVRSLSGRFAGAWVCSK